MNIAVLIVAAGQGSRVGGDLPKQYRLIAGQTVLAKTISGFSGIDGINPICVAIAKKDKELFESAISDFEVKPIHVIGGDSRTASVREGLKALEKYNPDTVLIHDAARPFVSTDLIQEVIASLEDHQAAVPALPIVDALKTLEGEHVDRDQLKRVQTPQGFHFQPILKLYQALGADESYADDIEVARRGGLSIKMCTGNEDNIKLTYERDFKRMDQRIGMISVTGSGFDVHQTCEGNSLWLCGVEIDAGFSLKGHSDADVGLHAITDALLGAISDGDIGDHFPPSDPQWKNARSDQFLKLAKDRVGQNDGVIDHVDVTLICEQPKIKPHREHMRQTIADILDISIKRISVKATTTEGLGYTGRKEGIAAQAIVNIRLPDV